MRAGRTVQEEFAARAATHPDALAIAAPDAELSYADLDRRSSALAERLLDLGVTTGAPVGLCLPRSAALVVGALGILRAGAAYVAMDPTYPDKRLAYMLADSGAAVLVAGRDGAARLAGAGVATLVVDAAAPEPDRVGRDVMPVAANDLAYIVYTSGSTGLPKGVMVEHRNLLNLVDWHRRAFAITADDRATQLASPGFDASVWELWPYLAAGASLHVPAEPLRTDPAGLRDWMVAQAITVSFLPTAVAEEMLALAWPPAPSLRLLLTGGDALHRRPGADIPFTVINNYGPAEATVVATSGRVDPTGNDNAAPGIGTPIDGVTIRIVDSSLAPVSAGAAGELLIGGAGVARGYVNRPDLSAQSFIPDTMGNATGRCLYRTGDLVRMRPDGQLEFMGRVDQQIKIRGQRIEPDEIAAALDRHPAVRASAVVATGDLPEQRRLVACVVPAAAERPDVASLRTHLASSLPEYMVPADFVWLTQMPLTHSGKIDRSALRASVAALPLPEIVGAGPRNDLEEALATIVAELLGLAAVGVDENFFLLGGHSLLGAQVITRINDRFGVELPLRDLFERPTIAAMAAGVEKLLVAQVEALSDEDAERLAAELDSGTMSAAGH